MVLLGHITQKNKDKIMIKYIDSEKLIDKIESRMELRNDVRNANGGYYPESKFMICDKEDDEILSIIDSLQQEQPDIDLIKFTEKIDTFTKRYKNNPEQVSIKGAMAFMARMFYQYPDTAREWYENLPNAIMD